MNYFVIPGFDKKSTVVSERDYYYIIQLVSDCTEISIDKLKSIHRYRPIVEARQMAMYLIRKYTKLPWYTIGKLFGGRDHTTAIHSVRTANNLLESNERFRTTLLLIETKLTS